MEFISAEEFIKQPIEVQKVFIDWWKPSIGDLFLWVKNDDDYEHDLRKLECCNSDNIVEMTKSFKGINEGDRIPLLTEGQLRKFIEEKTRAPSIIEPIYDKGYEIRTNSLEYDVFSGESFFKEKSYYEKLGTDLLKAYWKVAIKIAEQEVQTNDSKR